MTRYRTIVADPPWEIQRSMGFGGTRARPTAVPYPFMSLDEIKALPVVDLAEDSAHLYLWSTRRNFREGVAAEVARAWGFEPCGEIIWGLKNPGLGGSASLRPDHEPVLVARRGNLAFTGTSPAGVHFWRQRYSLGKYHGKLHSAKPDGFLDLVEQASPGPFLEMFARRARLGWDTYGDEALDGVEALT